MVVSFSYHGFIIYYVYFAYYIYIYIIDFLNNSDRWYL